MLKTRQSKGFTLIEMLVVLTIIALLLSVVSPRYFETVDRSKESTLRHDLLGMRDAIDKYYSDKNVYPDSLEDLVQTKYLRAIPVDPITDSASTWLVIPPAAAEEKGNLFDVRSGATGLAEDGTPYANW